MCRHVGMLAHTLYTRIGPMHPWQGDYFKSSSNLVVDQSRGTGWRGGCFADIGWEIAPSICISAYGSSGAGVSWSICGANRLRWVIQADLRARNSQVHHRIALLCHWRWWRWNAIPTRPSTTFPTQGEGDLVWHQAIFPWLINLVCLDER